MRTLSWANVLGRRLGRGCLVEPAPAAVAAASAAAGIHAQVLSAAELSLSARMPGLTRVEFERELWERRGLVKTWAQRGTLHLVPSCELPLWVAALRGEPREPDLVVAIATELARGPLTRGELADALGDDRLRSSWGELLGDAARAGSLCFGPGRGAASTFVRPDLWCGYGEEPAREDALREVLRRYLRAYGPARRADFRTWLGVDFWDGELEPVSVEGKRAFVLPGDEFEPVEPSVRLLPQYDAYLVGSRFGRDAVVPAALKERIREHGRGRWEGVIAIPTVVLDGIVAGFWRRGERELVVELHAPVPRAAVRAEADRIRAYLDADLELRYGAAF